MKNYIKSNLTLKLFLIIYATLIAVSMTICGLFAVIMPQSYIEVQNQRFITELNQLAETLEQVDIATAKELLEEFSIENEVYTALFLWGDVFVGGYGDTAVLPTTTFEIQDTIVFGKEYESPTVTLSGTIPTVEKGVQVIELNIFIEGIPYQLAAIGNHTEMVNEVILVLQSTVGWIILIVTLLALLLSWHLSKFITKPIRSLNIATKEIAELNFDIHCEETRTDEMGQLSNSINTLATTLHGALQTLQGEVQYQKELEEKQRLFFASASHELKTPLTIIKNKLEGMIYGYGEYRDRDTYLASTLRTSGEMERLINEILAVSQMNATSTVLEKEPIEIDALVEKIVEDYDDFIGTKKFDMVLSLSPTVVVADKKMLTRAIENIVSNAIKYSPDGAVIQIGLGDNTLAVENFGVTIAPEDTEKLCEPFYRIEKSRNRSTGGSGLGLHFVKAILEQHQFPFAITAKADSLLFTIYFTENTEIPCE